MTKGLILPALILFSLSAKPQSTVDILHYRFHIDLNDTNDTLYGMAIISLRFPEKTDSFTLDFHTQLKNGKGMMVVSSYFNDPGLHPPRLSYRPGEIAFSGNSHNKGDTTTLTVIYKGVPSDGLVISKNKFGRRTFFADNWPNRAHHWLPCKDDPADKATVEFIITAPIHYQVVANGIQVEESTMDNGFKKTHWKEDVPLPTKVMTVGIADFSVSLAGMVNDCIPVTSWVFPENRNPGFYDFEAAKDILPFFINYIGPYGYKKLANVQSKTIFGGLENANTIFYSQDIVTGDRSREGTIVHEIAHQWFGNMVTEKSFVHLWLSEGFATYFTILYFENSAGAVKARELREEDRRQAIEFSKTDNTPVVNKWQTDYMKLLNPNNYQKGGWVLHMLRVQLGDSVFRKIIRKFYADYAGGNADTQDFQKIAEEVSGKDLKNFFSQWLYTPDLPVLDITWKYQPEGKKIRITVKQLQKRPFSFPLEISISDNEQYREVHTFNISKAEEVFSIPITVVPIQLTADPGCHLLFTGNLSEIK
jgi:aminopeptidase N